MNGANSAESTDGGEKEGHSSLHSSFVQQIFQGTLTNETKCLSCENVRRDT